MAIISNYKKHIKLSDRIKIENGLNNGFSFRKISIEINKSITTISREIKNRRYKEKGNHFNGIPLKCEKLEKAPYVCNACPLAKKCRKSKFYYSSERAQEEYKKTLVDSRIGIDQTTQEFKELNKIIKDDIDKGHSFALILHNHPELELSERTLYHYQEHGYLASKNIDLPRKVRYKKRKNHTDNQQDIQKKEDQCRIGRSYKDFKVYIQENNISYFSEMDTVEGIIKADEPCLLTLYLKQCELLLIFKINFQTITEVNHQIKAIKDSIGYELFHKIFGIILTDNGSEFKCPSEIEENGPDVVNSKIFYCDAQRSNQKSQIELSHEYIRRYIPKGISMNNYTKQNILDKIGLYQVDSKDIILNDNLFKNN